MGKIPAQQPHSNMWGKARDKKAARMYHTRNFTTGHVEPNQHYLSRIGLRGRKRWIFLSVVVALYLMVIGHLVLTCVILGVLRFDSTGPPYFHFGEDGSLEFPEGAELTDVRVDGTVQAYLDSSLTLTGQNEEQVVFQAGNQRRSAADGRVLNSSQVRLGPSEIRLHPFNSFSVTHSGQQGLFVNSSIALMNNLQHLKQLRADSGVRSSYIRAPADGMLGVQSPDGSVNIRGIDGVHIGGTEVNITSTAASNVTLSSQGSVVIDGGQGITLAGLPSSLAGSLGRQHLCACNTGRLFTVPSNSRRCAGVSTADIVNICN